MNKPSSQTKFRIGQIMTWVVFKENGGGPGCGEVGRFDTKDKAISAANALAAAETRREALK